MPEPTIHNQLQYEWRDLMTSLSCEQLNAPNRFYDYSLTSPLGSFALFAELEDTRRSWLELLEHSKPDEYGGQLITKKWTVKDMLAHVASWACEFRCQIEAVSHGDSFDRGIAFALSPIGPTEWNEVEVEKRSSLSLERIKNEIDAETLRLQELLLDLPEDVICAEAQFPLSPTGDTSRLWRGNISQVVSMRCFHDRQHLDRIIRWQDSMEIEKA